MTKLYLLQYILFIGSLWASPFDGEILKYNAGFRFLPAGYAELSFKSDSLNGERVYLQTTKVYTNSFLDAVYKVRDEVHSWVNPESFSLLKIQQSIREGNYHKNHEATILGDSLAISGTTNRHIPGKVFEPTAFIYYLRTLLLNPGESYSFLSYGRKKVKQVEVNITGRESVQVPAGNYNCLRIEPVSADGTPLLKNNGEMRVWLSDDAHKLPVKIELKTNVGNLVMKLKEVTTSKH
ncbi:MAG: DUF3108 domain-containing protein [Candidatus Marinimicrobia bacterium]|jgi:hypothetical protein|nr:DUF3108 domain-containing protein [Candidatus Neomarinimicrobiota bacterium]MDP6936715.1 DUF3108 domain-containing protein [Candidatus Neomarinimicrobiota bacterium]